MSNAKTSAATVQAVREYQRTMGAVIIPENSREGTLARVFGERDALTLENCVFTMARGILPAYRGGYWDFVQLSDGGFYMALDVERVHLCRVDTNGFAGELSGDAAGLVVCLMTYSHVSFQCVDPLQRVLVEHFYKVREYIGEHPEASSIFAAID